MLRDHATPRLPGVPAVRVRETPRSPYEQADWTEASIERLLGRLREAGRSALDRLDDATLIAAWEATVAEFLDPHTATRRRLDPAWMQGCRLSPGGLQAGLEAVLGGVRGAPLRRLFRDARTATDRSLVSVILSGNLPALAAQPLLPALAVRRPVLLKSPSSEPLFAPAFVERLGAREPRLRDAIAALTWKGGNSAIERAVLDASGRVLAYGQGETMQRLRSAVGDRLVAYGPKISLAVVDGDVSADVVAGLARDVALFDQRGCLSIHAVFTTGDARALGRALADQLVDLARLWPPGPTDAAQLAAVQQVRADAALRGLELLPMPLLSGTVVIENEHELQISPGLRTVRIHSVASMTDVATLLTPWKGRIQGAALAGEQSADLESPLRNLGVSRIAPPGELQSVDALWHNGGIHPLAAIGAAGATPVADAAALERQS